MTKTSFRTVSEYIAKQPKDTQPVLRRVRSIIRKAVPKAEETISYQIPAYKVGDERLIYFAGWKQHYSLYPAPPELLAAFKDELEPYQISKGTIRLPLDRPVPEKLIARIAKFRAKQLAQSVQSSRR